MIYLEIIAAAWVLPTAAIAVAVAPALVIPSYRDRIKRVLVG